MNGFCLECHLILKKCWFEVGQSEFKHPVYDKQFQSSDLFDFAKLPFALLTRVQ